MNECEKYQEMISAMLDGELDPDQSEQLIAHMSSCARCRELYEMLSALSGSEVWQLPPAPEGLHEHIMSGVKKDAAKRRQKTLITRLRPWAMTAACLVLIVGIILGAPRFFRAGNSAPEAPYALNTSAAASDNNSAPAADTAAPADAPADDAGSGYEYDYIAQFGSGSDGTSEKSVPAENNTGSVSGGTDTPEPLPEPEAAPESAEPPELDMDIDRSVITVESGGKTTSEKLGRDDTLIWLKLVIEDRSGAGIDAAKIEIFRREGADYEVYIRRDGDKLIGSLSRDMTDSIELELLSDFAQFEEMADGVK